MFKKPLGFSNGGYINTHCFMVVGIPGAWLLSPLSKVVGLPNDRTSWLINGGSLTTYKSWMILQAGVKKPPFGEKARLEIEHSKEKPYHLEV